LQGGGELNLICKMELKGIFPSSKEGKADISGAVINYLYQYGSSSINKLQERGKGTRLTWREKTGPPPSKRYISGKRGQKGGGGRELPNIQRG